MGYVPSILVTGANGQLGSELKNFPQPILNTHLHFLPEMNFH